MKGKNCIWPSMDATCNSARKVNAQEGKPQVRDRIDQRFDEMLALWTQVIVLAAKRDDLNLRFLPGHAGNAITVKARAIKHESSRKLATGSCDDGLAAVASQALHFSIGFDRTAFRDDQIGILGANLCVVGNAGARNQEPGYASAVRFDFVRFFLCDHSETGNSISSPTFEEGVQLRNFAFVGSNDQFPANAKREAVFLEKTDHCCRAFDAEFRLQRTRLVIDSGVNDAAVVAALVASYLAFLFQYHQAEMWKRAAKVQRRGKPDDSAA